MIPFKIKEYLDNYIYQEVYVQIAVIKGTLGQLMWANCKACHSKYRVEH